MRNSATKWGGFWTNMSSEVRWGCLNLLSKIDQNSFFQHGATSCGECKKLRRLSRRCPWKLGVGCKHPASWKMPAGINKSQNRWWTSWFTTLIVILIIVTVSGSKNLDVTSFNFKSFRSTSPEQLVNASTLTFCQLYGFTQPSEMQDVRLHTSASVLGFQGVLRQTLEQAASELICQWQPENWLWPTWNAKPKMRIWFSVTR